MALVADGMKGRFYLHIIICKNVEYSGILCRFVVSLCIVQAYSVQETSRYEWGWGLSNTGDVIMLATFNKKLRD